MLKHLIIFCSVTLALIGAFILISLLIPWKHGIETYGVFNEFDPGTIIIFYLVVDLIIISIYYIRCIYYKYKTNKYFIFINYLVLSSIFVIGVFGRFFAYYISLVIYILPSALILYQLFKALYDGCDNLYDL